MGQRGRPKGKAGPRPFDPEVHCGWIKKNGEPCKNRKGHGTEHVGVGKCWKHPGGKSADANRTHGMTSKTLIHSLREQIEARKNDDVSEFIDLRSEAALIKTLLERFVERYEADVEKLDMWHATGSEDFETIVGSTNAQDIADAVDRFRKRWGKRPDINLDVAPLVALIEASRRITDTIHRIVTKDAIPGETFRRRILPQMRTPVISVCDEEQVRYINSFWKKIRW